MISCAQKWLSCLHTIKKYSGPLGLHNLIKCTLKCSILRDTSLHFSGDTCVLLLKSFWYLLLVTKHFYSVVLLLLLMRKICMLLNTDVIPNWGWIWSQGKDGVNTNQSEKLYCVLLHNTTSILNLGLCQCNLVINSNKKLTRKQWMGADNSIAHLEKCVPWTVQLSTVQFWTCVSKPPLSIYLAVFIVGGGFSQYVLGLLQSAGSASIEKAEPPWPIQQPPRALIQLKMNSLNLWRTEVQSWNWANRDPATRARLNLLNMKPNLGNNLISARNRVCFPQQIFTSAQSPFFDLPVL